MRKNKQLIFIELNEINFELVKTYLKSGANLPAFESLINNGVKITNSEEVYENIEPWIQWPSVHLGQDFSEHSIFRLGDIVNCGSEQIFEKVENLGLTVGCIAPMNARNSLSKPDFFIPDPWTKTNPDGYWHSRFIHQALSQAVNDNASERVTILSLIKLSMALLSQLSLRQLFSLIGEIKWAVSKKYRKAIFLDKILLNLLNAKLNKKKTDFVTIFLNAGAHLQHHYMHASSALISTKNTNPEWYLDPSVDPLLEVLQSYDEELGKLLSLDSVSILIATGLSQEPYENPQFYYRLKNHRDFMNKLGLKVKEIEPRMTRDFLMRFDTNLDRDAAIETLSSLKLNGEKFFAEVDLRENEAFVTLTYPWEIKDDAILYGQRDVRIKNLIDNLSFVAIKNGHHSQTGYVLSNDTEILNEIVSTGHVLQLHNVILQYFSNSKCPLNLPNNV
jgi:hypothetical protein